MSAPDWMPFYVAKYLGDTNHLSTLEHGAYMLLIMHYWQRGSIPIGDDGRIANVVRMQMPAWLEIKSTILEFFEADGSHKRVDKEIAESDARINAKSTSGKAGAAARWGKRGKRDASALPAHSERNANAMPTQCQTDAHIPIPIPIEDTSLRSVSSARDEPTTVCTEPIPKPGKRGTRLPENWELPHEGWNFALSEGLSPHDIDRELDQFRDYWQARAGPGGLKLDWLKTWKNRIRDIAPRYKNGRQFGASQAQGGRSRESDNLKAVTDAALSLIAQK